MQTGCVLRNEPFPVGFDWRDDVLGVTVSDDLAAWFLEDEDELEFAVEDGKLTSGESGPIRATADAAVDDVASRHWPFDQSEWAPFRPACVDPPLVLPAGWDTP